MLDLLAGSCASKCALPKCVCISYGLNSTNMCKLPNCDNQATRTESDDEEHPLEEAENIESEGNVRIEQQARSLLQILPVYVNHCKPISTTLPLQRKRQQRKWRPRVPPFHFYGDTHRLVRGVCVEGQRYGPLVDKPDYTFLDGRPTPLTPEQLAERQTRIELAEKAMKYLKEIDTVKEYNINGKPKLEKYGIPERIKGRS